jgi:MFS family permease
MDAYAVVTLLPQMLGDLELPIDRIEAASPIVTGFLGGYVVAMPLLGAYSDARGRLPVYALSCVLLALGSIVTAWSPGLSWLVLGRVLQGLSGGALVPLTLALAADLFPAGGGDGLGAGRGRALALGLVSGVQEAGSVVGPLYGAWLAALLASFGGWRGVFLFNVPLLVLLLALMWLAAGRPTLGGARRRLSSLATWRRSSGAAAVDWRSALLLGLGLGLLVVALYPDDPAHRATNLYVVPFGAAAMALLAVFGWRQARRLEPLVDRRLLRSRTFVGANLANLLAGGALMVALVDVPILGRAVFGLDQLQAGNLLVRFLAGVPVGALAGGFLAGRVGQRWTSVLGLLVAGAAYARMAGWQLHELRDAGLAAGLALFACGLGFGLVVAPLSSAVLGLTRRDEHGLASSLVVLARTLGMLISLSGLTAFGLHRFNQIFAARSCDRIQAAGLTERFTLLERCVRDSLLQEYHEIFLVAAGICVLGALVALVSLGGTASSVSPRPAPSRGPAAPD